MLHRPLILAALCALTGAFACGESSPASSSNPDSTGGAGGADPGAGGAGTGGAGTGGTGTGGAGKGGMGGMNPSGCDDADVGETETRTRYEAPEVAVGETCTTEEQTRLCTVEGWSAWSGSFEATSCMIATPSGDCGETAEGEEEERIRYEAASVSYGEECASEVQTRTCDDGEWTDFSGTFTEDTCSVLPGADCGAVAHGGTEERVRYLTSTVDFGQSCTEETQERVCTNGEFGEWSGSYTYAACTVGPAADCDGVAHGDVRERIRYEAESVAWDETCTQETQTQACNDGTWEAWTGSYTFQSCSVDPPASCGATPHEGTETRTRYETSTVPHGETCRSEEQSRACDNGTWGAWNGSFSYETCTVEEPFAGSCTLYHEGEMYSCLKATGSAHTSDVIEATCSGVYSSGNCSSASLLGICTMLGGDVYEQEMHYYQSAVYPDASAAETTCGLQGGSWSTP